MSVEHLDDLAGVETLRFKPSPVAILESKRDEPPSIGTGQLAHAKLGRRVAVAVSDGKLVFAALLTPAEAETFAHRILRTAAEAQSEGRA